MKATTQFEQYREFRKARALQKANKKAAALELKKRKNAKGHKPSRKREYFDFE